MSFPLRPVVGATAVLSLLAALPVQAQTLQSAARALDAAGTRSLQLSGSGSWFQFGQAPDPSLPWPRF